MKVWMEGNPLERRGRSSSQAGLCCPAADSVRSFWAASEGRARFHEPKLQGGELQVLIQKEYIYIYWLASIPALEQADSLSK